MSNVKKTILITGIAGALGRLLAQKLHRKHKVIGVDRRPFYDRPKDIEHFQLDIRRKSTLKKIEKAKPDVVIHLGIVHNPQSQKAYDFNINGTAQLLKLCRKINIEKFIYLSSANLYGPSAVSSSFLSEEAPLLAMTKSPHVRDLIAIDMMVQSFFWKQPSCDTIILRPTHIVGPNLKNAPSIYFRLKRIPTILGYDPLLQLLHEQDLLHAFEKALSPEKRGIFNIIGQSQAPLSRLIRARGAKAMPVPGFFLKPSLERMFKMYLTRFPSTELSHLRYSCLIDGARAEKYLNYKAQYSLKETILSL